MALQMCRHYMGDALCLEAMREIPGPRRHPFHVQAPLAFAIKMKHLRNNFKAANLVNYRDEKGATNREGKM